MFKDTLIYGAAVEPVPGLPCVKEVAEVLERRAGIAAAWAQTPGYRMLEVRFRKARVDGMLAARSGTDEAVEEADAKARAFAALLDMPLTLVAEAGLAREMVSEPSHGDGGTDFTEESAAEALLAAEAIAEMAKHPGWALALREHGARQRALASLMTMTRGEAREAIRRLSLAHDGMMIEILQLLRLGADAEAWQMQHTPEAQGKE